MSINNAYYLVETYVPQCDYSDGEVVALTPEACDKLANNRIPHRVINDFFSEDFFTNESIILISCFLRKKYPSNINTFPIISGKFIGNFFPHPSQKQADKSG